jgi:carbamoyl-phosphate synthase large subunit
LNDLDLPILSADRSRFLERGVTPVVSEPDVINTCFDKWKTVQFLHKIGLQTPKTYKSLDSAVNAVETGELDFPLVVKPRWGSGSIGVEFVDDRKELMLAWPLTLSKIKRSILNRASQKDMEHAVLIQEKINGTEFGLDVVNDLNGRYVATITKQKLAMRAGETDKAVTVSNPELANIGQIIGMELRHIANLDCDVFEKDGRYYVLELNPRFGGGYPFSQMAGANIPAAILCWLRQCQPDSRYFHFDAGRVFSKCDTLIEIPH